MLCAAPTRGPREALRSILFRSRSCRVSQTSCGEPTAETSRACVLPSAGGLVGRKDREER